MNKQDYARLGQEDAHAGNQARRPATPGTWQYKAYMSAWEAEHDEKVAPKGELVKLFRTAVSYSPSKHERRLAKRTAAFKRKMDRKARLASADRDQRRKEGAHKSYGRNHLWVSDNIKRAPRSGRQRNAD